MKTYYFTVSELNDRQRYSYLFATKESNNLFETNRTHDALVKAFPSPEFSIERSERPAVWTSATINTPTEGDK